MIALKFSVKTIDHTAFSLTLKVINVEGWGPQIKYRPCSIFSQKRYHAKTVIKQNDPEEQLRRSSRTNIRQKVRIITKGSKDIYSISFAVNDTWCDLIS